MAQEYFDQLHEAVKQAESRGQRFDETGKLLTSPKGAEGEMQVMPKTARKPGFGVEPAKDRSPDEIARVGRDYLKAMVDKYGDTEKALIAYNWGPKNADDWLASGADKSKLPKETQGYITRVFSKLNTTTPPAKPPAPTTEPTPAEKIMTGMTGMSAKADIKSLAQEAGPGYKAAMAMMFLADDKPDDEKTDVWKEAQPAAPDLMAPSALADLNLEYKSPFPEKKPVRMAEGGEAKKMLDDLPNFEDTSGMPFEMIKGGNKMNVEDKQIEDMMLGLGTNSSMLGLNLSKMKQGEKENLAQNLMAAYRTKIGDTDVSVMGMRPTGAPPGTYMGGVTAAVPVYGNDRVILGATGMQTPYQSGMTGVNLGYSGNVGPGRLDAMMMQPVNSSQGRSYQVQYRLPVGRAEGSPKEGEYVSVLARDMSNPEYRAYLEKRQAIEPDYTDIALVAPIVRGVQSAAKELAALGKARTAATDVRIGWDHQDWQSIVGKKPWIEPSPAPFPAPATAQEKALLTKKSILSALDDVSEQANKHMLRMDLPNLIRNERDRMQARSQEPTPLEVYMRRGQEQMPIVRGVTSPIHRAEGSPMGGENADHLTPQEIERMAMAQGPAFLTPSSGRGRQAGNISKALASGEAYPAIARGVAELPYDVVGGPVDLATLAMRPFGYDEKKPVMGSDFIKEKMTKYGIRPGEEANPTLQGFRTAGELGASLVNPIPVSTKVGQAVEKGATAVGKEAAKQMLRGMEGEGPLAAVSPPVMYAVKPRGGTFATSGSLSEPPISRFDELLSNYAEELKNKIPKPEGWSGAISSWVSNPQYDAVDAFIDKKARKYFINEFGTANDPLRKAMASGEMPIYGKDVEQFPEYLLAAARDPNAPGHLQAKRHLEKYYDDKTNIQLQSLSLAPDPHDADARSLFNRKMADFQTKQRDLMTAEGLPEEYQNPAFLNKHTFQDLKDYPNSTEAFRKMVELGEQNRLPSNLKYALQNEQPIYMANQPDMDFLKPKVLAETLATIPPEKLKNMSFEQAVIEGTKNMRVYREYDTAVERASKNLSVPKQVMSMFTKPVTKSTDGEWVKLTEPIATKLEGKLMHHSVGGYADNPNYNLGGPEAIKSGKANIFSLRNGKTGMPEVTLEVERLPNGEWGLNQIKGDYNSFPSHRAEEVFQFIDKHPQIKKISGEFYPKDNTGVNLPKGIHVDWQGSYEHWKTGMPGEWRIQRSSDVADNYIYTLPAGEPPIKRSKGGMVERNKNDNRKYL